MSFRPGGQLVVLSMAKTDDGDFGYRLVVDALIGALMDLAAEGVVSPEEIEKMAIPTYGRTRAEFEAPFADSGHMPVSPLPRLRSSSARTTFTRTMKGTRCRHVRPALGGLCARFDLPDAGASPRRRWGGEGRQSTIFSRRGSPRASRWRRDPTPFPLPLSGETGQRGLNPPHHRPFRQ